MTSATYWDPIIENENTKFPTFIDNDLEILMKFPITKESLLLELQSCDESFTWLSQKYDNLFIQKSQITYDFKQALIKNKWNYLSIRWSFLFFHRQILFMYLTLKTKFTPKLHDSLRVEHDLVIQSIFNIDKNIFIQDFFLSHSEYSEEIDNEGIMNQFDEYFQNEIIWKKMLIEFGSSYIPSVTTLEISLKFIRTLIINIIQHLDEILKLSNMSEYSSADLLCLLSNMHKIEVSCLIFSSIYRIPDNNIFNKEENEKDWLIIRKNYLRIVIHTKPAMMRKLDKVSEMVNIGYASLSKVWENEIIFCDEWDFPTKAKTGAYMAYYFWNKNEAKWQAMRFLIQPNPKISQTIWNILDTKELKSAMKVILPSISYRKSFYWLRTEKEINSNEIEYWKNKIKDENFFTNKQKIVNILEKTVFERENFSCCNEFNCNNQFENDSFISDIKPINSELLIEHFKDKKDKEKNKTNYVKIKWLHSSKLYLHNDKNNFISSLNNYCSCFPQYKKNDSIIIHIHGGGFVAMSPSSHENYTRKWVNALTIPIWSVDYRLSPVYPYPCALDDVFQVYMWVVNYMESIFDIRLKNIILIGDSAGGNLVIAWTYLLILKELRLPNAIFLAYPAMKLNMQDFSLSYLNSLTDPILDFGLMKFCLESYCKDSKDPFDPFMSPWYMDSRLIKYLPPVRIFGGSSDPLRDDYFLFLEKLAQVNHDVMYKEIKYFPHGFLNYDINMMWPEVSIVNEMIVDEIKKFIT